MNRSILKPVALSIVVVSLGLIAALGLLDQQSETFSGEAFKRALITFGIARGLNGVISVAQGTEVALHPAGLGVNFAPGQILDPINDLVEQFSWIMLASSASLGIQQVLLTITSTLFVTIVFVLFLLAFLVALWRPAIVSPEVSKFLKLAVIFLVFIRFSVPLATLASEGLYRLFLQEQYKESTISLTKTSDDISKISAEENKAYANENEGIVDKAKRIFNSTSQSMDINKQIKKYQELAAETTKHAINIIVVFILQTILIPLLFLWLSYKSCRQMWINVQPVQG